MSQFLNWQLTILARYFDAKTESWTEQNATAKTYPLLNNFILEELVDGDLVGINIFYYSVEHGRIEAMWLDNHLGNGGQTYLYTQAEKDSEYIFVSESDQLTRQRFFNIKEGYYEWSLEALINGKWQQQIHYIHSLQKS